MNGSTAQFLGQWITVDYRRNSNQKTRLGITVTKRYGKAHERNRFKRLVRESFRLSYSNLPMGYDIVVKPRSAAKSAMMNDIKLEIQRSLPAN